MNKILLLCCLLIVGSLAWAQSSSLPEVIISHEGRLSSTMTEYVRGTITLRVAGQSDTTFSARFKTRGATAKAYSQKPSLNVKLCQMVNDVEVETDASLLGMRTVSSLILDAMAIDRIQMRNRVAFDVWNEYSALPYTTSFASRNGTEGRFVEVTINGDYKGIYCLSDKINRKLLDVKKPELDDNGQLLSIRGAIYKHGTNDVGNQNEAGYFNDFATYVIQYHDAWELSVPDEYPCEQAWDALNTLYDHRSDIAWLKEHFYLNQLAEYQVFIIGLAIQDNWGNKNSFISVRNMRETGEKNKYVYTPWDLDTSLGGSYNGSYHNGTYSNWPVASAMGASSMPVPFSQLAGDSEYKAALRNAWLKGSKKALSVAAVSQRLTDYRDLLLESGAWQRQQEHPNGAQLCADLTAEVDMIISWYAQRFPEMDAYFGTTDADREAYTALENIKEETTSSAQKIFRDGQLLILHQGKLYNLQGQELGN